MNRVLVIVDGQRCTIYALDGVTATERASLIVEDTSPGAIATLVNGLSPFLAAGIARRPLPVAAAVKAAPRPASVPPAKRATTRAKPGPRPGRPPVTLATIVDYVRAHPGSTFAEIGAGVGVSKPRINQVLLDSGTAGLRYEQSHRSAPRHWYVKEGSKQ